VHGPADAAAAHLQDQEAGHHLPHQQLQPCRHGMLSSFHLGLRLNSKPLNSTFLLLDAVHLAAANVTVTRSAASTAPHIPEQNSSMSQQLHVTAALFYGRAAPCQSSSILWQSSSVESCVVTRWWSLVLQVLREAQTRMQQAPPPPGSSSPQKEAGLGTTGTATRKEFEVSFAALFPLCRTQLHTSTLSAYNTTRQLWLLDVLCRTQDISVVCA